jgi:hypothetical protein
MMKMAATLWAALLPIAEGSAQPLQAQEAPQLYQGSRSVVTVEPVSWEGFMQDRNFDQFITIDLRPQSNGSAGTFHVLGNAIPVSDVVWTGGRITARLGALADNLTLAATREGNWLSGELREGNNVQRFALREIPQYPAPRNRTERWNQDFDSLTRRFTVLDRSMSPGERALFIEAVEAIRSNLDQLSDAQVIMQMASAIALADEPHTRLLLLRNATELRRLPIRVWWFDEGLYIIRTSPEYRSLLGCRLDDFDQVPARQARDLVGRAFAGNPSWRDYLTTYTLTSPEALHGLGVTRQLDQVEIGVSGCRAAGRRTIQPMPLARSDRTVESWWDLSPLRESPHGITAHVLEEGRRGLPLYLRNPTANYAFEYLPDSGTLYFQFTRSDNARGETMAAFGERLLREVESRRPRALVLDVRFNTGGNASLSRDLFRRLNELTASTPRYLISGRTTFSAGISAMGQFLSGGPATIVGERAGDDLDHWSEGGYVRLPNSGLEIDFQTVLHSYSRPPCPRDISCVDMSIGSIEPEVLVSLTWRDYVLRRDPAMDAVLAHLARGSR